MTQQPMRDMSRAAWAWVLSVRWIFAAGFLCLLRCSRVSAHPRTVYGASCYFMTTEGSLHVTLHSLSKWQRWPASCRFKSLIKDSLHSLQGSKPQGSNHWTKAWFIQRCPMGAQINWSPWSDDSMMKRLAVICEGVKQGCVIAPTLVSSWVLS